MHFYRFKVHFFPLRCTFFLKGAFFSFEVHFYPFEVHFFLWGALLSIWGALFSFEVHFFLLRCIFFFWGVLLSIWGVISLKRDVIFVLLRCENFRTLFLFKIGRVKVRAIFHFFFWNFCVFFSFCIFRNSKLLFKGWKGIKKVNFSFLQLLANYIIN